MIFAIAATVLAIIIIIYIQFFTNSNRNLKGKHVMISGGSSGIGIEVAKQVFLAGANVTILARDEIKLRKAKETLEHLKQDNTDAAAVGKIGEVQTYSLDVGGSKSSLVRAVHQAEKVFGSVYMLINCAGFAKAARFEDVSEESARNMMDVNFMGSYFLTQEVVKSMKKVNCGGIIVFVSSQGGLFGIFGYTAYAAAKGALVKFAEALLMEVKPYNISVTVSYPPDTDTPGFEQENKSKPLETELISQSGGLFKPGEIAKVLIDDSLKKKFSSSVGLEGFMLKTLCAGMAPITDIGSVLCQIFLSGIFRLISIYYLLSFQQIVSSEKKKKVKENFD